MYDRCKMHNRKVQRVLCLSRSAKPYGNLCKFFTNLGSSPDKIPKSLPGSHQITKTLGEPGVLKKNTAPCVRAVNFTKCFFIGLYCLVACFCPVGYLFRQLCAGLRSGC